MRQWHWLNVLKNVSMKCSGSRKHGKLQSTSDNLSTDSNAADHPFQSQHYFPRGARIFRKYCWFHLMIFSLFIPGIVATS
jgi:hypothetical protein